MHHLMETRLITIQLLEVSQKGFTEGYLTMDAIAAIAFSMIVVNAIKATGLNMQIKYLNKLLCQD